MCGETGNLEAQHHERFNLEDSLFMFSLCSSFQCEQIVTNEACSLSVWSEEGRADNLKVKKEIKISSFKIIVNILCHVFLSLIMNSKFVIHTKKLNCTM